MSVTLRPTNYTNEGNIMNHQPLVLYHANCTDGFCAAWVAHRRWPNAEFIPVQYGQDPPEVRGRDVYVFDFSYKRPVLLRMWEQANRLVVRDHHKTAEAELVNLPTGGDISVLFDVNKSGGRLAWEYLFASGESVPWLVDYTEDHDLWAWKLDWSREISAFIASHPHDFRLWNEWATTPPGCPAWDRFVDAGSAILRYQAQLIDNICGAAREVELDGYKVLAVNTCCLFSEVAGKLADGRPFGAAYFTRSDGKTQWSLRSRDGGIDVSEVAQRRGGGGHRNAAGFEFDA